MQEILSLLYQIRKSPKIFLGQPSLDLLKAFVDGCICYINERDHIFVDFLPGFQEFVQRKYKIVDDYSWKTIIQNETSSEEEAFYKFFDLLDEFFK